MIEIRRAFAIILVFMILFFWFGLAAANELGLPAVSNTANSNTKILFDVFIGKKRIGEHLFLLGKSSDGVKVKSRASFDYRLFNISLYKYNHYSEENYDSKNCLTKINSSTLTETKVRGSLREKVTGERRDNSP